jgi:membrane protein implicated in regulation of membrane protease activity
MNIFIQTLLGIIALIVGVSLLYFFMAGLSTGVNFLFLILSLVFIGAGTFLFVRVSKIENTNPELNEASTKDSVQTNSKLLDKNNQMIKEWSQLNSKKDNLKAVQMAVGAEVQAKSNQQ